MITHLCAHASKATVTGGSQRRGTVRRNLTALAEVAVLPADEWRPMSEAAERIGMAVAGCVARLVGQGSGAVVASLAMGIGQSTAQEW